MTIATTRYTRVPFPVDAVQVTEENLEEIAVWTDGQVKTANRTIRDENGKPTGQKEKAEYISIETHRPLNERQKRAFVGDWVLRSESGFKIYTEKAFDSCFTLMEPQGEDPFVDAAIAEMTS
jgi:hypothetical protein